MVRAKRIYGLRLHDFDAGNAWAALGMLRVAVTIQKTEHCSDMTSQIANLTSWIKEILDGEFAALVRRGLLLWPLGPPP
jgi:hypothetical protein